MHTQGGLWPPQESWYLRGVRGLAPASSEVSRSRGWFGGPQARQYTHKAVHTQCGAHAKRSVATVGVLVFKGGGPRVERSEPKEVVVWRSTGNARCKRYVEASHIPIRGGGGAQVQGLLRDVG